ncbi:hypothetical protein [Lysinibacillus sphaericus]|uniref:hypothetical protein n=1 Tax=Lysinibacillus sphaericus TaxID=1421 RepID=UPI0018CCDF6E|nr:hypothetical protein [Lysinibacillus sphaericus]
MRNKYFIFSILSTLFLLFLSGCTDQKEDTELATISTNTDSKYANTFKDLNLGILFDYNFKLNNADENWVDLWVERYKDGKLDSNSLTKLSYGQSPTEVEKGHIGFGILNTDDESFAFLYGPGMKSTPQKIGKIPSTENSVSGWYYAFGDETVKLKLNETYVLGVYSESKGNSLRTYDLQDENEVKKMIDDVHVVYLLKLKIHNESN